MAREKQKKKIDESQNGFRNGYGTRDALMIMNTIIENKIMEKREREDLGNVSRSESGSR